jgi:hypothetical protein
MSEEKKDAVAVVGSPALAAALLTQFGGLVPSAERPEGIDPNDLNGTNIPINEMRVPRLAIAQGLSPQLVPTEASFIKGLTIGDLFNDVTNKIYDQPLLVVPVARSVVRIQFDPKDKKVILDRNVPAGDKRLDWDGDNAPLATEFFEYACLLLAKDAAPELVMVSIKATNKYQRRAAINWNTYIGTRNAPIYTGMYGISSKIEKGVSKKTGQDTMYGTFVIKNAGFVPTNTPVGKALVAYAKDQYEKLNGVTTTLDVKREGGDDDDDFDAAKYEAEAAAAAKPGM